jgi:transcriptional regulator GlxA family with amidase domain
MITVSALVTPQSLASSLTLPLEIWMAAGQVQQGLTRSSKIQVQTHTVGLDIQPITLNSGITITPDYCINTAPKADVWILPAQWRNPLKLKQFSQTLAPLINSALADQSIVCSVGTASFILADMGLLNAKPGTTHWAYLDLFQAHYPEVHLKRRHLITQSHNLYCVGSVNSIADLMVHLIEKKMGITVAQAVEQQFSPEIRRKFEAAAYQDQSGTAHHDELVLEAQIWLDARSHQEITIKDLAGEMGISIRNLNRRFKIATGITPAEYHKRRRLEEAKSLLKNSNLPLGDLSWQLGFSDPAQFSRWFKGMCHLTPSRYRQASRGKLFTHTL